MSQTLASRRGKTQKSGRPPCFSLLGRCAVQFLINECSPLKDVLQENINVLSESSLSGHEAGLGLLSRCPGDDPVHQTRDTSRAVPPHSCNGNGGLEHTKPLVRYPLCQARCLSLDVL